jgi:hypothetical protein
MAVERSRTQVTPTVRASRGPRPALGVVMGLLLWSVPAPARALTVEISGQVTLRPQEVTRALSTTQRTVLFTDESLRATARVGATDAEKKAVARIVLQRQHAATTAWQDLHTFYVAPPALVTPTKPGVVVPTVPTRPERLPERVGPKQESPLPAPGQRVPVSPSLSYDAPSFSLPAETSGLRARAVREDGTAIESLPLLLEVRSAPAVLTLLAMGGTCTDPDANTTHTTLDAAAITRNAGACEKKGVQPTYLGDLTPMPSVNCNNPCASCTNFMEHLALRIMNDRGLATSFDSIDNPGQNFCQRRTNAAGIRNRLVFGKWRNTDEEPVCSTSIKFNAMIADFVQNGGKSLILIGQSQGGAKFAGMVRDHWRWGNALTLELLVLWDATSFDVPKPTSNPLITSMGVDRVGSRPRHTLSFYQYSNLVPFQNGARLLDPAEQYDLDGCFSHNAIARSQFVHHKTTDAVKRALEAIRDRARSAP